MVTHPFAPVLGGWGRLLQPVVGCMLAAVLLWLSPLAALEEGVGLGALYALRGPLDAPQNILIVSADAASSRKLGVSERVDRWPRRLHARLVDGMTTHGAVAIGFDLLFQQSREAEDDAMLQAAIRKAGNVVLVEGVRRELTHAADGRLLATVDERIVPHAMFAEAAHATAPFVLPKTPHGVLAFWEAVPALGDRASLPLQLARLYRARAEGAGLTVDAAGGDASRQPGAVPARDATRYLNLHGPLGTVATTGYAEALAALSDHAAAEALFRGKIVLVGTSEANQSRQVDAYRTPYTGRDGLDVSGVELCATAVANLLQRNWLQRPGGGAALALVVAAAALLALPWVWSGAAMATALTLGIALAYAGAAHVAFSHFQLWLPLVVPAGIVPLVAIGLGLALRYRQARQERAGFARAAELGIPARAAARLREVMGSAGDGGTVFAVCMCSDIEGYTGLAESLSPLEMRNRLNAYLERFLPVVERSGGYAADFVGDSVMTVWIAEEARDAVIARACDAALALDRLLNRGGAPIALRTRFGLHCGPVFFGAVGGDGRRELRVVGDIVNTASRIQGLNKYLGTRIIASSAVAEVLAPTRRRRLGRFALVGKAEALSLYALRDGPVPAGMGGETEAAFEAGLAAFERGDFALAEDCFARAAQGDGPDDGTGAPAFFRAQCRQLRAASPVGWDGVVRLGVK